MNFLLDLANAGIGMVLGAVAGFFGALPFLLQMELHPAVATGLAVLAALFFAGVLGIVGANVRTWLSGRSGLPRA